MSALLIVCFFTAIIHMTETLALSMRLAGVRTRQVATSLSFLNSALLVSRMSNMLQAPFLGGMVDFAILHGTVGTLDTKFRLIIFSAFCGALLAAFFLPTFVAIFTRGIYYFERTGSVPRTILKGLSFKGLRVIGGSFRFPHLGSIREMSLKNIPKTFLWLNLFIGALYAIGVLVSLYAGAQLPQYRTIASQLSGIVNGIATILLALMVDPAGARITDQAVRGMRPEKDVRTVVFFLVLGRVFGVLVLSQLFFLPCTEYIKNVTLLMAHIFGR